MDRNRAQTSSEELTALSRLQSEPIEKLWRLRGEALETSLEAIPREQLKEQLEVGYLYQTPTEQEMRDGLYNCDIYGMGCLRRGST